MALRKNIFFCVLAALGFVSFSVRAQSDIVSAAGDYYRRGRELYSKGDYIRANEAFKKAEAILDASAPAAAESQDPTGKPQLLNDYGPESAAAQGPFTVRAQDAFKAGDYTRAAALYEQALRDDKKNNSIKYNLALSYLANENYNKASALFKDILKHNPKDIDACYNLGVIYESFLPDYPQALVYYRQYLKYASGSRDGKKVKDWVEYIERQIN